jgi:L-lactate permease
LADAVAATGMARSEEGKLIRFTIKHSDFLASVLGVIATI